MVAAALALLPLMAAQPVAAAPQVVDRVIATVDGDPITMADLLSYAKQAGVTLPTGDNPGDQAIQRKVLHGLIEETALEHDESQVDVSDEDVNHFIRNFARQHNLSEAQLRQAVQQNGISWKQYRKQARQAVQKLELFERQVRDKVVITDGQIEAYYKAHRDQFKARAERYKLAQILIACPLNAPAATATADRKKAEAVRKRLLGGADFAELARKYSDDASAKQGGELGFYKPSEILDPVLNGIKNLKVGQISNVIRTKYGFHIIKVEQHEEPGIQPLADVKDAIRKKLSQQAMKTQFKRWVRDDLLQNHTVHIYL